MNGATFFSIDETDDGFYSFTIANQKFILKNETQFEDWISEMFNGLQHVLEHISKDLGDEDKYLEALKQMRSEEQTRILV